MPHTPGPPSKLRAGFPELRSRPHSYFPFEDGPDRSTFEPGAITSFLRRRRWSILVGFVSVVALVALLTWLLPERYESSASFLVEPPSSQTGAEALNILQRLDRVQNTQTEATLLQGRGVIEPVVERLHLQIRLDGSDSGTPIDSLLPNLSVSRDARPGTYRLERSGSRMQAVDSSGQTLASAPVGAELSFAGIRFDVPQASLTSRPKLEVLPFEKAVDQTRRRVSAKPAEEQSNLVRITCDAPSASAARDLCRAVSDSYLQLRSNLQTAEASAAAEFLQGQVVQVQGRLSTAEDSLQTYEEQRRAVALKDRATEEVKQYADLRAQREQLSAEHDALASLIDKLRGGGAGPSAYRQLASFPTFLKNENNVVATLVESLVELENRRSELAVKRKEANPELAALDTRIDQIDDQLLSVATSYERSLAAQIRSLGQALDNHGKELATIPVQEVALSRLRRQVDVLEKLYRFLQTRLQEAQVAKAVRLPNVRMVDEASLPYQPSFPNLPLNLAIGIVLGLGVGLVGALWREHADDRLRDRSEVEESGLPVLAMVPRVRGPVAQVVAGSDGRTQILPPDENGDGRSDRVAEEAFRSLAFELEVAGRRLDEANLRSVSVTSSTRGEGKTFCACNLAAQAAWLGKNTLLIDADAHAHGVARWLKLAHGRVGLGDVLQGGADPEVAIQTIAVGGGCTLDVLQAGEYLRRSAWLLSPRFQRLIDHLSAKYDLVLIDTPPLNVLSDAAQVASAVDGVVVVVRGGVTERHGLELTLQRLERAGGRLIGVVLNAVELPGYYTSYTGVMDHGG